MPFVCMLFKACNQLSTSAAEAHKMAMMTLEDHSSKSRSHLMRPMIPRHASATPAESDTIVLLHLYLLPLQLPRLLQLLQLLCVFAVDNLGLLVHAGCLLSFACTIRHISIGALLCLRRGRLETLCWPHSDHSAGAPLVTDACFPFARVLRLDLNKELV